MFLQFTGDPDDLVTVGNKKLYLSEWKQHDHLFLG